MLRDAAYSTYRYTQRRARSNMIVDTRIALRINRYAIADHVTITVKRNLSTVVPPYVPYGYQYVTYVMILRSVR